MTFRPLHIIRSGKLLQGACAFALLTILQVGDADTATAQTSGDYRTLSSGDFSDPGIWEIYFWGGWWPNVGPPDINDETITIRSNHSVTMDTGGDFDQIVVESGATLTITQSVTFLDGPGTDLVVFGTLNIEQNSHIEGTASAVFRDGSELNVDQNERLFFRDDAVGVFESGSYVEIGASGRIVVRDDSSVDFSADVQVNNNAYLVIRDNANATVSGGTITNEGNVRVNGSSSMTFESGSEYIHAQDGGRFPTDGKTTFNPGSSVVVTGVTGSLPNQMNNTYGDFTWDSPSQNSNIDLRGNVDAIAGDFIINDTGSGILIMDGGSGSTLPVGGDFMLNGGKFGLTNNKASELSVDGNANIGSGTILYLAGNGTSGTLSISGDLDIDGQIITAGSGQGSIVMDGSTPQTISQTGVVSGDIDLVIDGSGGVSSSTDLSIPGSVMETTGGLDMGGNDLSLEGDLTITTSLTNAGALEFTGSGTSTLTLPAGSQTIPSLTVDKSSGELTLGADLTVTDFVVVSGGSFDEGGFVLTLEEGATFYSDQPVTGTVTISRTFNQNSDGWRMIASPVQDVSYSDLNTAFYTQGAPWATESSGTPNLQAFNFGSQDWTPISGSDGSFSVGTGYILYAFAQDDQGASLLPTTWSVTGTPGALSSQSIPWSGSSATSWTLVGNPSTANLDWDLTEAASTGIAASYATWDPAETDGGGTTGYKYYDATSGIGSAGRYIAPFTAIMVQATTSGASLQPTSSPEAATQTAQQFGKTGSIAPHFRISVEGEGLAEPEMVFSFGAEATTESGAFDVVRLTPLSTQYATLWSENAGRRLAFDGRTMASGREIYDLVFATTRRGTYRLAVEEVFEIPEQWRARMVDLESGRELPLHSGEALTFQSRESDLVTADSRLNQQRKPRFRVIIENPDQVDSSDIAYAGVDVEPVLSQNYPNPFNPVTTIRFSLPESAPVRLEVFDMIGRRVARLADGVLEPGWHEARFNGSSLSSGMYVYRLSVAGQVHTRSMLLFR